MIKLLVALLSFSSAGYAEPNKLLMQINGVKVSECQVELSDEVNLRGGLFNWVTRPQGRKGQNIFRTPTKTTGHWIEVTLVKGHPTLFEITNERTVEVKFGHFCKRTKKIKQGMNFAKSENDKMGTWFSDKNLRSLLKNKHAGIIYVWSPGMSYSAKFYKMFQNTARRSDLAFTGIIDPHAKITFVDKITKKYGLPMSDSKLNSVEMYMRNTTSHFPTTLVYRNGKIHPEPIVGVMSEEMLERQILQRQMDLMRP